MTVACDSEKESLPVKNNSNKSSLVKTNLEVDVSKFFDPTILQAAMSIAQRLSKAGCFTKDVKNAEMAFVKIQTGYEMGMPPMQAMNSLYITNGQVTIWGKALIDRLINFGWDLEFPVSNDNECTCIISKGDKKHEDFISPADLVRIKKKLAYGLDPKAKLRYHVVSRLIRFYAPDVLGPVQYCAEELDGEEKNKPKVVEKQQAKQIESNILPSTDKDSIQDRIKLAISERNLDKMQQCREDLLSHHPDENRSRWIKRIDTIICDIKNVTIKPESNFSFDEFFSWTCEAMHKNGSDADSEILQVLKSKTFDNSQIVFSKIQALKVYDKIKNVCINSAELLKIIGGIE